MAKARKKPATRKQPTSKQPTTRKQPKPRTKPTIADSPKQPVLIAVKVPASPTSDTGPARKLLEAIGRRPTPKHKRRR